MRTYDCHVTIDCYHYPLLMPVLLTHLKSHTLLANQVMNYIDSIYLVQRLYQFHLIFAVKQTVVRAMGHSLQMKLVGHIMAMKGTLVIQIGQVLHQYHN